MSESDAQRASKFGEWGKPDASLPNLHFPRSRHRRSNVSDLGHERAPAHRLEHAGNLRWADRSTVRPRVEQGEYGLRDPLPTVCHEVH